MTRDFLDEVQVPSFCWMIKVSHLDAQYSGAVRVA